jgi:branched-chain amino acid transport system permease protein
MFRGPTRPAAIFLAALLVLLLALPLFGGPYALKFATRMIVLATFVLSLDLLIGITGLVSFGHAAFFGIGAYAVYFISPEAEAANALLALAAGAGLAAAAALAIGAFALLTRGFYFIMVTLAAGQMIFSLFHDTDIAKGSDGAYVNVKPAFAIGNLVLLDFADKVPFYYVTIAILVMTYGALFVFVRSPFGRVLQAIKVNEMRTGALGFNTYLFKLAAFTIAGAIAGLAGALFASIDGFVTPELMSWHQSGLAIMMVVLGGAGTLFGPILGALAYISFEDFLKTASLVGPFVAGHWRLGTGLTLIIAVLLSPEGLAGFFNWLPTKPRASVVPRPIATTSVDDRAQLRSQSGLSLATSGLSKHFGGLAALSDVTVQFTPNRVHAIIGPNGAGKTTFGNLLSGALAPSAGKVAIDNVDVTGKAAFRIARLGLGRSFQRSNIFPRFTVVENCALAAQAGVPLLTRLRDAPHRASEQAAVAHALAVTGLSERPQAIASQLSHGEQRQLEIAMLVASGARLMILDEPLAGMGPEETKRVVALLRALAADHTIVLIEHDMDAVFAVADTLTVLVQGRLLAHDLPAAVRRNEAVVEAYLGHKAKPELGS